MVTIGIDYSINSPGITIKNKSHHISYFYTEKLKHIGHIHKSNEYEIVGIELPILYTSEQNRYELLALTVLDIIKNYNKNDLTINIEGYSYASHVASLFPLAENMSILKYILYKNGYSFNLIPPSKLKKKATDKGNANKDKVYEAFVDDTGLDLLTIFNKKSKKISSPLSDIADSYWLTKF